MSGSRAAFPYPATVMIPTASIIFWPDRYESARRTWVSVTDFSSAPTCPYVYTPGKQGVELLEYRSSNAFDIKLLANNPDWWSKAVGTIAERRPEWDIEQPPSTMT